MGLRGYLWFALAKVESCKRLPIAALGRGRFLICSILVLSSQGSLSACWGGDEGSSEAPGVLNATPSVTQVANDSSLPSEAARSGKPLGEGYHSGECAVALGGHREALVVARAGVTEATSQFLIQYAQMVMPAHAQVPHLVPSSLSPWMVRYILSEWSLEKQRRMAVVLRGLRGIPLVQWRDVWQAGLGDSALVEDTEALYRQVRELKAFHKKAVALALEKHGMQNQRYGPWPYQEHLHQVRGVLKSFDLGPHGSLLGLRLGTLAWLHDVLEDTATTPDEMSLRLAPQWSEWVQALSNAGRKEDTFRRISMYLECRLVKLADRTANVEYSLRNACRGMEGKIDKYRAEWPLFKQILFREGEAEGLWTHLSRLLEDNDYAHAFTLYRLSLEQQRREREGE